MTPREPARGLGSAFLQHVIDVPRVAPYRSGFPTLDLSLLGIHPAQLLVIGGDTGVAKTGFAERLALNLAGDDVPVTYCQLELPKQSARERFLAKLHGSSVPGFYSDLQSDFGEYVDKARATIARLDSLPLQLIARDPRPKVTWKPMSARDMFEVAYRNGSKALVMDHFREIEGAMDGRTRDGRHAASVVVQQIADLVVASGLAVILLHQLAIDPVHMSRRPSKAQFMDTKLLAQKADAIVLVHRPFRAIGGIDDRVAELLVEKNRNGREGCTHVHFLPAPIDFCGMTPEESYTAPCCFAANEKRRKAREAAAAAREAS